MAAIVRPVTWDDWPDVARSVFQGFRSPAGEHMILDNNVFIEQVLPGLVLCDLTNAEMDHYRRPYLTPGEDRRPTLTWPRQIPIDNEPADVTAIASDYAEWLSTDDSVPKLFIDTDPGGSLAAAGRGFCRTWPSQTEVTVAGSHFLQEDSPDQIGTAIADWYRRTLTPK